MLNGNIYIYIGWLICFHKHLGRSATNPFSIFQNPNSRSEPFILFSILISAWRPNFTFFGIFLLFIKLILKLLIQRDFQSGLINSKKIPKNVKFGLQADINMENKMNGLDRSFGLRISDLLSKAQGCLCFAKHGSLTQYI